MKHKSSHSQIDDEVEGVIWFYAKKAQIIYDELVVQGDQAAGRLYWEHLGCELRDEDPVIQLCRKILVFNAGSHSLSPQEAHRRYRVNTMAFAIDTSNAMFRLEADLLTPQQFERALMAIGERYVGAAWRGYLMEKNSPSDQLRADRANEN
jgi:hypothetical protein